MNFHQQHFYSLQQQQERQPQQQQQQQQQQQEMLLPWEIMKYMNNNTNNNINSITTSSPNNFNMTGQIDLNAEQFHLGVSENYLHSDVFDILDEETFSSPRYSFDAMTPSPSSSSSLNDEDFDIYDEDEKSLLTQLIFDDSYSLATDSDDTDFTNHQLPIGSQLQQSVIHPPSSSLSLQEQKALSTSSSEDDDEMDERKIQRKQTPRRRSQQQTGGRMSTAGISGKKTKRRRRSNLMKPGSQLYQFILQLLDDEEKQDLIRWEQPNEGIFRILNKDKVANMWGEARKRKITYDSLSRGLRHYYSQGLLIAVNKKLHYQFTEKALKEWEVIRDKESIEDVVGGI